MITTPTTSPINVQINNKADDMYKRLMAVAELLRRPAGQYHGDKAHPKEREKTHELEAVVP